MKERFLVGVLVLSLLLGGIGIALQRSPQADPTVQSFEPRYYPESGHSVSGEFLKKYLQAPHPEQIYGLPITDPFYSNEAQSIVQYFENARFELYPDYPPELRVRVTPLGQMLLDHSQATPLEIPYPLGRCRSFPETGFSVCHEFLDFFERNGGVRIFGYPISDVLLQDGLIVQYFQLLRIQWVGTESTSSPVQVSALGKRYFSLAQEDARLLAASSLNNNAPQLIRALRLRAFPKDAVVPASGVQSIYVLAQDQSDRPVAEAMIGLRILLPDGVEVYPPAPKLSDVNGIARFDFPYYSTELGLALVKVQAQYGNLSATSDTSFRIWK
ncbi:MAG: hypothetical protein DDG59_10670 [Anaerolineae bacterium]|jgi:hypothetical protein|nr:MAG: hypothetical protein DDG59_10670 [Anaerolineae bacterium]